jgi:hypothetical protein
MEKNTRPGRYITRQLRRERNRNVTTLLGGTRGKIMPEKEKASDRTNFFFG